MNKRTKSSRVVVAIVALLCAASRAYAHTVQTHDGKPPLVHWAILVSTDGNMKEMQDCAVKFVAPEVANEPGTYALYGGVDAADPNVLRLLEIYEDQAAYERHVGSVPFGKYREARAPILERLDIVETEPIALEQKPSGRGTFLVMRRFRVDPNKRDEWRDAVRREARRAVAQREGVLGLFATAERDDPNVVRTLEIYSDEVAFQNAENTPEARAFRAIVAPCERDLERVYVKDANVPLSAKGLRDEK